MLARIAGGTKSSKTDTAVADAVDAILGNPASMALQSRTEHLFSWWHQGVMLFDRDYPWSDGFEEYVEAASGEWLDQSRSGGVTFVAPGGAVFDSTGAPLTLDVHSDEPPIDEQAESIGEFDLHITSGVLVIEESGGGDGRTEIAAPLGAWRARWSGFGEAALEEQDHSENGVDTPRPDRYRLELWPAAAPTPANRLRG